MTLARDEKDRLLVIEPRLPRRRSRSTSWGAMSRSLVLEPGLTAHECCITSAWPCTPLEHGTVRHTRPGTLGPSSKGDVVMSEHRLGLAFVCFTVLVSCGRARHDDDAGAGTSGSDSGTGARAGAGAAGVGGRDATAVDGGYCCPIDKQPGCCMSYGGFSRRRDGCGATCDGMPVPSEDWKRGYDSHGCPIWIEPTEWTDCCGCAPRDAGTEGECDATGTWQIDYASFFDEPCWPRDETITLTSDDDAGTDDVTFQARGRRASSCGPSDNGRYEKSVVKTRSGCVVTLASHANWCAYGEPQCEDLELVLNLDGDLQNTATIEGTFRTCWCDSSGPEGTTIQLTGTATRTTN